MTASPDLLRRMREAIVHLYEDWASAERLADEAGLDSALIERAARPVDFWHNILEEAERQGKVDALLALAILEYPARVELVALRYEYRQRQEMDQAQAKAIPVLREQGGVQQPAQATQRAPRAALRFWWPWLAAGVLVVTIVAVMVTQVLRGDDGGTPTPLPGKTDTVVAVVTPTGKGGDESTPVALPGETAAVRAAATLTTDLSSVEPTTASISDFIYGFSDPGGEHLLLEAGAPGWIVFPEAIGHDPQDLSGSDFSRWSDRGLGVIVVLANGYEPDGTLPDSAFYEDFGARCANYVSASRGARIWVVGNEMNHVAERPGVAFDRSSEPARLIQSGEVITPERYVRAYRLCRDAIHGVAGHQSDEVLVGAVAPWVPTTMYPGNSTGDWVGYFRDILTLLGPEGCDGFTLHTHTHGDDPELVNADVLMDAPFQNRQYHFRAYRDFMNAVPAGMRHLPAYITGADQDEAWKNENTGWVQQAYAEINDWNSEPAAQKIRALVLYRWAAAFDDWGIEGKAGVIEDLRQALAQQYVWRNPPPSMSFITDRLPQHPTEAYAQRTLSQITHIVVHRTDTGADVPAESLARYAVEQQNWPGIGYHFIIGPGGLIEQTNRLETVSYHASRANAFSVGIAFAGSFDDTIPTPEQIESGARLVAWLMVRLNIPIERVIGHEEVPDNVTSCPGAQWLEGRRWKNLLLIRVDEILKPPPPPVAPATTG